MLLRRTFDVDVLRCASCGGRLYLLAGLRDGLPVATTVQFRFRAVTTAGVGDWSQPTALVVK